MSIPYGNDLKKGEDKTANSLIEGVGGRQILERVEHYCVCVNGNAFCDVLDIILLASFLRITVHAKIPIISLLLMPCHSSRVKRNSLYMLAKK